MTNQFHNARNNFQKTLGQRIQAFFRRNENQFKNAQEYFPSSPGERIQLLGLKSLGVSGVFDPRVGGVKCSSNTASNRKRMINLLLIRPTWVSLRKIVISLANKYLRESLQVKTLGKNLQNLLEKIEKMDYNQYAQILPSVLNLVCTFEGDAKGNINLSNVIEKAIKLENTICCMLGC